MKKTLRETLLYLFEAEDNTAVAPPVGSHKINEELTILVRVEKDGRFASFSLIGKPKGKTKIDPTLSLSKRQELMNIQKEEEDLSISKEDMKKIMGFIVGYLRKWKIKEATITFGRSRAGITGLDLLRKYFEGKEEFYEGEKEPVENRKFLLHIHKGRKGKKYNKEASGEVVQKPKKTKEPKEKKPSSNVFDEGGSEGGVKRVYKIEKDAEGNIIKKYSRLFPKYSHIRKLTHVLKRQEGGTVEIYNYYSKKEAGLLKKKITWREKQYQDELDDIAKIRTTPQSEVKRRNETYINLKRELRTEIRYQLSLAKGVKEKFPEQMDKDIRANINKSLGRFDVITDWEDYDEDKKNAIVLATVRDIRNRYRDFF